MPAGDVLRSDGIASIEKACATAQSQCGVRFVVRVGVLPDGRESALALHAEVADDDAVLVAVDPGSRTIEIVSGARARRRVDDRACALATLSMLSSFAGGNLAGGIRQGLMTLADQARRPITLHVDQP